MDIVTATRGYERWMRAELARAGLAPLQADLRLKHRSMAEDGIFVFLRATYYRWAQLWPEQCPGLAKGPRVLAVGDLHLENFGTWRDAEGRLCWGVNDFDEAFPLAYANDLVRLATSALLAAGQGAFRAKPAAIADAILAGYGDGLTAMLEPIVLEERNAALRAMAYHREKEPKRWWAKLADELYAARPPERLRASLSHEWNDADEIRFFYRSAGKGSLGRPRYVARAFWRGALAAREAKALIPSAAAWAAGAKGAGSHYADLLRRAAPCLDPLLHLEDHWILRRLAPRSSKIEIDALPSKSDPLRLLRAMGRAAANIHRATPKAVAAIRRDLTRRKARWLADAAEIMAAATRIDWKMWRKHGDRG